MKKIVINVITILPICFLVMGYLFYRGMINSPVSYFLYPLYFSYSIVFGLIGVFLIFKNRRSFLAVLFMSLCLTALSGWVGLCCNLGLKEWVHLNIDATKIREWLLEEEFIGKVGDAKKVELPECLIDIPIPMTFMEIVEYEDEKILIIRFSRRSDLLIRSKDCEVFDKLQYGKKLMPFVYVRHG